VWSVGVTLAGYALGSHISNVDRYLLPDHRCLVVVSLIPVAVELRRHARGTPEAGVELRAARPEPPAGSYPA